MGNLEQKARQYQRFDAERQIAFYFNYDFQTALEFRGKASEEKQAPVKHSGVSKNISAEGLCFTSNKALRQGEALQLDVFLLDHKNTVRLEGEVRWSRSVSSEREEEPSFETGVKLIAVEGKPVHDTIHYDETYHVIWSAALESVIGNFRILAQQKKEPSQS
jgi:hypothetical protein